MQWKSNVDKLILEWLANRTPPSCIRVNMVSMALAINPQSEIVKEVPCVKYIRNLRTVLSLVTKCLAGQVVGSCTKIKQLHTDGTSHKGTEIVNLICRILTDDKQLKTICLAGDIIPEDGTAECQSTAIVNQFSETGRLLEGWRDMTSEIYANDPELSSLLLQIPKKEDICVSKTLGATLESDNCSTARLNQSLMSQKCIAIAKQVGINDKTKLYHSYGHCFNHQRNTLCKAVAGGFNRRIGEALAKDLPSFAHHHRISSDLMNVHR